MPDTRVGWASVAVDPETGNVYAHGVEGMFLCFNRDGKLLWSKSLTELYSRHFRFRRAHQHADHR